VSPRPMVFVVEKRRNAACAGHFEHALNHEHHVGAAGVILVEHERRIGLQRVGQNAFAELRDLHAVLQNDRVLADEIDTRDVAIEIDADAGPVEARCDLLNVGRLAGTVIALNHHAPVVFEAGENGERNLAIEQIVRIEIWNMFIGFRIGRNFEIGFDPEHLANREFHVGKAGRGGRRSSGGLRAH
jgi:hypothetical protein